MVGHLEAVEQHHALFCLANARLLTNIAAADRSEEWKADGAKSMADWLGYRFGISANNGKELVRVARTLEERPALASAHLDGSLSYDKVRAVATISTPEDEADLVDEALSLTITHLESRAKRSRAATDEDMAAAVGRFVRVRRQRDGSVRGSFKLPPVEGPAFEKALDRAAEEACFNIPRADRPPLEVRRADALVRLTRGAGEPGRGAAKPTVVVHIKDEMVTARRGWGYVQGGSDIPAETIRRLACFGCVQLVTRNNAGEPLGIGRASRVVPPWLEALVWERDQGCVVPGCGATKYCEIHHLWSWVDGGPTDLWNLALTCGFHHTLIHEKGWLLIRLEDATWLLIRPDGTALDRWPPVLRQDVAARLLGVWREPELLDTS